MKKSGHYRRAYWLGDLDKNFGGIIEQCLDSYGANAIPRFEISAGQECIIARRTLRNNRRYLHFVSFEAGAPAAVINTAVQGQAAEIDAAEQGLEAGQEFIQHQLFCIVENNDLVWTTHNSPLRESSIQLLFSRLIESAGLGGNTGNTQFGFQVVLDEEKIQELFDNGIAEIDLGVGALRPTLERIANGGRLPQDGFLGAIATLFQQAPTAEQIEAAQFVEGKLVLRTGRDWEKPAVIDLMSSMSNAVRADYDDEFAIITKSGFRLTRDKVSLQRVFEVQGNKRVVSSLEVDRALREMFADLEADGVLDA